MADVVMADVVMAATVLITGAGSGIGLALARCFSADGYRVIGVDLPERVGAAAGVCTVAMAADVRRPDDLAEVVAAATEEGGRIDALIANAGLARKSLLAEADWEDIQEVLQVNIGGVIHSIRAVLPTMQAQGHGRIVSLVSRNAELCPRKLASYNASKAAVVVLSRTLARELEGSRILVNNLIPGPARTAMNDRGTIDPDACYPTARMLVDLPDDGPTGRTFFEGRDYPMWARFSDPGEESGPPTANGVVSRSSVS